MQRDCLPTPSFLVDLDILQHNIDTYAQFACENGKQLWPMVKTHKSTYIARLQRAAGAAGFLAATIQEADTLLNAGLGPVMLAYPPANPAVVRRIIAMANKGEVYISLDHAACAQIVQRELELANACLPYVMIIDSGLHRYGVQPSQAPALASDIARCDRLQLVGIATHPGQVYAAESPCAVEQCAVAEQQALQSARHLLACSGFAISMAAGGSTPTFSWSVRHGSMEILRPGNYVFMDQIQLSLGVCRLENCSASVLTTVCSQHGNYLLTDCGSKCLGLDKGAHSSSLITNFGLVKDHPELTVSSLSEEVGKLVSNGPSHVKVGDKLAIIPNHSCVAANMTNYLCGMRNGQLECLIPVDMRSNSLPPVFTDHD